MDISYHFGGTCKKFSTKIQYNLFWTPKIVCREQMVGKTMVNILRYSLTLQNIWELMWRTRVHHISYVFQILFVKYFREPVSSSPSPMNPSYFTELCSALCFSLTLKLLQGIASVEYTAIKNYNFISNILFKLPNHPVRWVLYVSD